MSSNSRPPDEITFFVDRSLGRRTVPDKLRALGADVIVHDELFAQDCPDEEWLHVIGARGWVVLTRDTRIKTRPIEIQAFCDAEVLGFVLTAKNLTGEEAARAFELAVPRMKQAALDATRPAMYSVNRTGRISRIKDIGR